MLREITIDNLANTVNWVQIVKGTNKIAIFHSNTDTD